MRRLAAAAALAVLLTASPSSADIPGPRQVPGLWLPNASPTATVSQTVGLTDIEVFYHRPSANDRVLWGGLVPYGQVWRTGANENTTVRFSSDVKVQGQPLAAGTYGLHTLPTAGQWEIIFSRDVRAWGSFSYDAAQDALRVTATPETAPHQEAMLFTFDTVTPESAVLALRWGTLRVPIEITVDVAAVTLASIRDQLKGLAQFSWQGWSQAANWCLQNDVNLEEAVQWADNSIGAESRFENHSVKAQLLAKLGDTAGSEAAMATALDLANAGQLHNHGRQLLAQGDTAGALAIFQRNAEANPDVWFIGVGLARGYSAVGEFAKAAAAMRDAMGKAPAGQEAYLGGLLAQLEAGTDIN